MAYVNYVGLAKRILLRYSCPFSLACSVQGEVWHECEALSLYYTSMFKVYRNPFPDRSNVTVNDSGTIADIIAVASDSVV